VYYLHGKISPTQNRLIFYVKRNRTKRVFRFLAIELADSIGEMLNAERVPPEGVLVTYVPRRRRAQAEYGVDQAKALAAELARELSVPLVPTLKRSGRYQKPQKQLSGKERFREVKKAYLLKKKTDVRGKDVILVDDTVTTGATMATCVRLLKKAGAKRVFCASVAVDDTNRDRPEERRS